MAPRGAGAREGRLHRVRVWHAELAADDDSPCGALAALHLEAALGEAKVGIPPREDEREHAHALAAAARVALRAEPEALAAGRVAAVHKDVVLATVAVEVAEEDGPARAYDVLNHAPRVVDGRVAPPVRTVPRAVEVLPCERAAIVSVHHAVGVEHRHRLEDKELAEARSRGARSEQKVEHTLHHPARVALARVHARREHDVRALLSAGGEARKVGDGEEVAAVASHGCAQERAPHDVARAEPRSPARRPPARTQRQRVQVALQVAVRVREAHRNEVPLCRRELEREGDAVHAGPFVAARQPRLARFPLLGRAFAPAAAAAAFRTRAAPFATPAPAS
mmetsp:Transcript_3488/g.12506  ORF Transcript_3488/g.12506 Transcript_3488/m.12506 type:complete len:337 (+) Transcript_3488:263-1273(+)